MLLCVTAVRQFIFYHPDTLYNLQGKRVDKPKHEVVIDRGMKKIHY
ncbi:MAG: hypothetical protein IKX25_03685 [Bacteroidales bacterium]|nr:hypothetical protein [Bacteroidales bacterium]